MSRDCARELELLVRSGWRLIALETFEEGRGVKLLERLAGSLGCRLRLWSVASGLSPDGEGAGSLDLGLQAIRSCDEPGLFVLLDAHRELEDSRAVRRLRDLLPEVLRRKQTLVLLGPLLELPPELAREVGRVELPLPVARELEPLLRKLAPEPEEEGSARLTACVSASLGLTGDEAARVFRRALRETGGLGEETATRIVRAKRGALRRIRALTFHETDVGLGDIGGLGELKRWLGERRRAFTEEARAFGLPAPRGLLLLGVQGCGKSLSAKAIAREWNFPLLRLDLAAAFGNPQRGPEMLMREATAVAESIAPSVLWIDEIEKGFARASSDARSSRVFGAFLTWLSEKDAPVFVVATANSVTELPPELLRRGRFDEVFFIDLPTPAERLEILAIHLSRRGREPSHYALEELAAESERLSGAELEEAVNAGLHAAFAEGRDLEDRDLANAIQETVPLYETYEEHIKELRNWASTRARPATLDARMSDLFARS